MMRFYVAHKLLPAWQEREVEALVGSCSSSPCGGWHLRVAIQFELSGQGDAPQA